MLEYLSSTWLVHAASIVYVAAFLVRDQLILRSLVLLGTVLYIFYYYIVPEIPLWDAIIWSIILTGANLFIFIQMIMERRHFKLSSDEQRLYDSLEGLTPGQFRKLMQAGTWVLAAQRTQITTQDEVPHELYFVLDGNITIDKSGRKFVVKPGVFIGEVSWLLDTPASASVLVESNAKYVAWDALGLRKIFTRNPALRIAFEGLMNRDMAKKVARN